MYLCICNALKERVFQESAERAGARCVVSAFKANGARPKCGRCLEEAARIVAAPAAAIPAE